MISVIQLLRPQQWLKNLFVFLPIFFSRHLLDWDFLFPSILVFVAFSLCASSVYCFNDIYDVEEDRKHPVKSKRPIASGQVSKKRAVVICGICSAIGLAFSVTTPSVMIFLVLYLILNIGYCVYLKHIAIIDVFVIASGFVLRLFAGSYASNVVLSHWIVLMTFLLATFLAISKRRDDLVLLHNTGIQVRKSTGEFNLDFMNHAISVIASATLIAYIMYTVSPEVVQRLGTNNLYLTSVFVLAGILRYLQITLVKLESGSPTHILMHDSFIQICVALWIAAFWVILYV